MTWTVPHDAHRLVEGPEPCRGVRADRRVGRWGVRNFANPLTAVVSLTVPEEFIATLTAQRDRARDVAARLEGEIARVRDVVTAWSLGETSRDEMVLWAIREIVGLTPARPETPTPWPHPDAEVAP